MNDMSCLPSKNLQTREEEGLLNTVTLVCLMSTRATARENRVL